MPRAQMAETLKSSFLMIMDNGGVIKDVKNLGLKRLPFKMNRYFEPYVNYDGHYFVVDIEGKPTIGKTIQENLSESKDFLKHNIFKVQEYIKPCWEKDAENCHYGENQNPNYEKTERILHGFRWY